MTYDQTVRFWRGPAKKLGAEYGVRDSLILGIICQESSGNVTAESGCGARGLMQIMKPALSDFNAKAGYPTPLVWEDMFYQPLLNMRVGTWYISWLLEQFDGDEEAALRAYNVGIGTVKKNLDPKAGRDYAMKILTVHEPRVMVELKQAKEL